jgi:hypothetical protein
VNGDNDGDKRVTWDNADAIIVSGDNASNILTSGDIMLVKSKLVKTMLVL